MKSKTARTLATGIMFPALLLAMGTANAAAPTYEVQTPVSVSESAPWKAADKPEPKAAVGGTRSSASGEVQGVKPGASPFPTSVDESRPWLPR